MNRRLKVFPPMAQESLPHGQTKLYMLMTVYKHPSRPTSHQRESHFFNHFSSSEKFANVSFQQPYLFMKRIKGNSTSLLSLLFPYMITILIFYFQNLTYHVQNHLAQCLYHTRKTCMVATYGMAIYSPLPWGTPIFKAYISTKSLLMYVGKGHQKDMLANFPKVELNVG